MTGKCFFLWPFGQISLPREPVPYQETDARGHPAFIIQTGNLSCLGRGGEEEEEEEEAGWQVTERICQGSAEKTNNAWRGVSNSCRYVNVLETNGVDQSINWTGDQSRMARVPSTYGVCQPFAKRSGGEGSNHTRVVCMHARLLLRSFGREWKLPKEEEEGATAAADHPRISLASLRRCLVCITYL